MKLKIKLHYKHYFILILILIFTCRYIYSSNLLPSINNSFSGTIIDKILYEETNMYLIRNKHNVIVYSKDSYEIGDQLIIAGEFIQIKKETVPNIFDISKHYKSKRIYYKIYNPTISKIGVSKSILIKLKKMLINKINNHKHKEYLYLTILGKTTYLDNNVKEYLNELNMLFLFTINSLYVYQILKVFKKINNETIGYIILYIYLFILDFSFSFLRPLITSKVKIKTKTDYLIITLIFLAIWPLYVYQPGFWYSTIIVFFVKFTNNLKNKKDVILLVSLPLTVYYNYQLSLVSIIAYMIQGYYNVILIPITIISLVSSFFNPILEIIITVFETTIILLSKINITFVLFKPSILSLTIFYILIYMLFQKNKNINKKIIVTLMISYIIIKKTLPFNHIIFLDVEQGNSTLLTTNNNAYLFDTGGKHSNPEYYVKTKIIPYLKTIGYSQIDYLFISHGDLDHIGGAKYLLENNMVKQVIINNNELTKLEKETLKYKNVTKNQKFTLINKDLKIQSINPINSGDENANSLVFLITYNNYKILLTGDISKKEELLLNNNLIKNIDILQIAHHGSKYSTDPIFIKRTNPTNSIISHACNNRYNHPNNEVLDILKNKTTVYSTCQDGSIFVIMKKNFKIKTTI